MLDHVTLVDVDDVGVDHDDHCSRGQLPKHSVHGSDLVQVTESHPEKLYHREVLRTFSYVESHRDLRDELVLPCDRLGGDVVRRQLEHISVAHGHLEAQVAKGLRREVHVQVAPGVLSEATEVDEQDSPGPVPPRASEEEEQTEA